MSRTIPLKPGLLLSLSTRLEGGVAYSREDLDHQREGVEETTSWKTEKRVDDVEELARATRVRGRVRSLIRSATIYTPFGMICPTDNESVLDARIAEAETLCAEFNANAVHTQVQFRTLRGRIAENTREAIAAVRGEIQTLLGELESALSAGQVTGIREVAQRATQMGRLLEEGTEARSVLERAVKESRRVATELVKRVEEGAAATAEILAAANLKLVSTARHTFSDEEIGEITDGAGLTLPSAPLQRFGDLGEEYVPDPFLPDSEPEPVESAGERAGSQIAGMLAAALTEFGTHAFDDRGSHEVMIMEDLLALLAPLSHEDAARALQRVQERDPERGAQLVEDLLEEMPEEVATAISAIHAHQYRASHPQAAGEAAPDDDYHDNGLVVPLASLTDLIRRRRRSPEAARDPQAPGDPAAPPDDYPEEEI
jgi:hypothetical protein